MTESRRNIKCSTETFERLSDLRNEEWDDFLNEMADAYERRNELEVSTPTNESDIQHEESPAELEKMDDKLDDILTAIKDIPEETVSNIENTFRY